MSGMSKVNWNAVAATLSNHAKNPPTDPFDANGQQLLDCGQRRALARMACRIRRGARMTLLADEVGMGKTRIAVALIDAVKREGGRAAIVLPAGLGSQWRDELRRFDPSSMPLLPLRSYQSFIEGFSEKSRGCDTGKSDRNARRNQRELPEVSWSNEKVLMISHSFAAMRFPDNEGWRRHLLGAVLTRLEIPVPGFPKEHTGTMRDASNICANMIVHAMAEAGVSLVDIKAKYELDTETLANPMSLAAARFRSTLLPFIGIALGRFDLVVIDEAHKSRGEDSSLSRILGPVTWENGDAFRLGMTATPVELDSKQWLNTLQRLRGDGAPELDTQLETEVEQYVGIVERLQVEEIDENLTEAFEEAASALRNSLGKHVIRRDKRSDPDFRDYVTRYREVDIRYAEPSKGMTNFTQDWLRRFAAFEALSQLPDTGTELKRKRISLAQGFGFDTSSTGDEVQLTASGEVEKTEDRAVPTGSRLEFWCDQIGSGTDEDEIYTHPAILKAVETIEGYTNKGEKVLVLGRFIKPLKALTGLLDAREMLRCLQSDGNRHWPGSTVLNEAALRHAMQDPVLWSGSTDTTEIERLLKQRYKSWRERRKKKLVELRTQIEKSAEEAAARLLGLWKGNEEVESNLHEPWFMTKLLRALDLQRPADLDDWNAAALIKAFGDLVSRLDEEDMGGGNKRLLAYLEDFAGNTGHFARLMSGETPAQTRHNLQTAFNRQASWPMVLVAQSRVGREGLNLQRACRVVVLLHSEWNPGIVEQQIGRVDRKNSRWLEMMHDWKASEGSLESFPTIRIHPIVVRGTYAEHNWQVLEQRWRALRAQLHGDVLQINSETARDEKKHLLDRVRKAALRFDP